jgi:hypothetical protein
MSTRLGRTLPRGWNKWILGSVSEATPGAFYLTLSWFSTFTDLSAGRRIMATLDEAKRRFLASVLNAEVPDERNHADAKLDHIRSLREEVARLTRVLLVDTGEDMFDDLFVGRVDELTGLPAPPNVEGLRRLHKQQFDYTVSAGEQTDLNLLLTRLADHNRSHLDGLSSIDAPRLRAPLRRDKVTPMEEIECQVLLSYIMQACAIYDDRSSDTVQSSLMHRTLHTDPSVGVTRIDGNNSHLVAHASRVAGGRVSSGTKSSSVPSNHPSRSRSTPSSGNRQDHSIASVATQKGAEASHHSRASVRGSGHGGVTTDESVASQDHDTTGGYGFETRGNVRFDESTLVAAASRATAEVPPMQTSAEDVAASRATMQQSSLMPLSMTGHMPHSTDALGVSQSVSPTTQLTEPTEFSTSLKPRSKPTGKFGRKSKSTESKGFFSCMADDTDE